MYCLSDGQELELEELLLEDETTLLLKDELTLLLEEVDVLVLVDVEDDSTIEELLSKEETALLDGMQPTTSNNTARGTSNIFFLIIKQLFDLF